VVQNHTGQFTFESISAFGKDAIMPAVKKFLAIFLSSSLYEAIGKLPVRFFQLLFCMVVFDLFFVSRFAGVGAGLRMNHWLVL